MSPLLLLKLPLLVQKSIVHQWDLNTVFLILASFNLPFYRFSFSILSEKTKNQLQQCNLKAEKFSLSIYEARSDDRSSIHLESLEDFLGIDIVNGSNLLVGNLIMDEKFKPVSLQEVKYEPQSVDSIMTIKKLLEKSTQHLLSFLKVCKFELRFGGDVDLINFFLWNYAAKFDSIMIGINNRKPVYLTPNELKFLLEDVTTDYLKLNVAIEEHPNFEYPTTTSQQKPPKIRKIKIRYSSWIDLNKLVLMDFVSIDVNFMCGSVQQWKSILKSWMSGTNEKLEELKLCGYSFLRAQRDRIFEGIKAKPTVFTDKELRNRYSNVEGAIKMDIIREHDGRQATVILYRCYFVMLVWNEEKLKAIGRL